MPDTIKTRISAVARLRNYFLTGLIICAPVGITAYLVWSLIGWIDSWIIPYIPEIYNPDTYLPFSIPGFLDEVGNHTFSTHEKPPQTIIL